MTVPFRRAARFSSAMLVPVNLFAVVTVVQAGVYTMNEVFYGDSDCTYPFVYAYHEGAMSYRGTGPSTIAVLLCHLCSSCSLRAVELEHGAHGGLHPGDPGDCGGGQLPQQHLPVRRYAKSRRSHAVMSLQASTGLLANSTSSPPAPLMRATQPSSSTAASPDTMATPMCSRLPRRALRRSASPSSPRTLRWSAARPCEMPAPSCIADFRGVHPGRPAVC